MGSVAGALIGGVLFGERSTLRDSLRGDNLVLNGVWQRHGGEDSYTFTEQGADTFALDSHVLETVLISKAQFVTLPADPTDPSLVATRFVLWGSLRFKALAEADVFSFGPQSATDTRISTALPWTARIISARFSRTARNSSGSGARYCLPE